MRRMMGAVMLVLLAGAISKARAGDREDAQSALDEQMERAMLAADRVAPADGNKWHFNLEGMWLYGPVSGHMQTPSGGLPGTSSIGRPTLKEMGIKHANVFDGELIGESGPHGFYIGGRWTWM